jgi:hypothetical protein
LSLPSDTSTIASPSARPAVEETVDEMQIAGPAAAGADGEAAGDVGVGARGEGGDLLMAHVQPFDAAAPAHGVAEAVQGVADDP